MANPRLPGPSDPEEFPQVEPTELHPTNNIRFVMWEVARLTERLDQLVTTVDKLSTAVEKNADRHADALREVTEKQSAAFEKALAAHGADTKERLADIKTSVDSVKDDVKIVKNDLIEVEKKVAFVKGAMWVLGGLFAIALIIVGVLARKLIGA